MILPIRYAAYQVIASEPQRFRHWLDDPLIEYPELFPAEITHGYTLHDVLPASVKLPGIRFRRIKLKAVSETGQQQVLTIASRDVLPSMRGYTDEVEKALFVRRFGVPFWGLSYVFGRDDAYWYRLTCHFGRYEIVGTVVKHPTSLPTDLLADEKHVHFNGEKGYIATTVGADRVLGASLTLAANEAALTEAYGYFKAEASHVDPAYTPQTVNTDGWSATPKAWQTLFRAITIIQCFLHASLTIRDRTKQRYRALYDQMQHHVWAIYQTVDREAFFGKVAALQGWAVQGLAGTALDAVEKLCAKADAFAVAFDYPTAYRTSNMIDRHMIPLDRWLVAARHFHGHWASAERQIRAWALFHDFMPFCPRAKSARHATSPVHRLNRFIYHDNWLHNLLISTSCTGFKTHHRKNQN